MSSSKLEAILCEVGEVRKAIEATRGAIYTTFGIVLPGLVGVFVLTADKAELTSFQKDNIAIAFVVLASMGILWTQNLWMEVLRYARYYYVALMPRLYRESDQATELSFLAWSGKRSLVSQLPILFFDIGALVILAGVFWVFIYPAERPLVNFICMAFFVSVLISVTCVIKEVHALECEIAGIAAGHSDSRGGNAA